MRQDARVQGRIRYSLIGLVICMLSYVASNYISEAILKEHVYFVGHALGLLVISFSFSGTIGDIVKGFSIGRLFDEIYFFVLGNPETEYSTSLILVFAFPIVGALYRSYTARFKESIVVIAIILILKKLMSLLICLFKIIFA